MQVKIPHMLDPELVRYRRWNALNCATERMYVSWVLVDKLRIVMSSIMRWRRGEIGFGIGELLSLDCTNVQSLQTGDCLPIPSLRSSRPTGRRQTIRSSNPTFAIGNWAADLRHGLATAERFSATDVMEFGRDRAGHSALMPVNFTTLPHFSVSSTMSLSKSLVEPVSAMPLRYASRVLILW